MPFKTRHAALLILLSSAAMVAQQPDAKPASTPTTAAEAPNRDTSFMDAQGTAHVTRVVPVPQTVSAEAQKSIGRAEPDQGPQQPLAERRQGTDAYTARARVEWTKLCPNQIVEEKMAGVPVRIVTQDGLPEANKDKVLLNLHGGGFGGRLQGVAEDVQAGAHRHLRHLGGSDSNCGSGGEAEATGAADAGGAGHLQRDGRLCAAGRLDRHV